MGATKPVVGETAPTDPWKVTAADRAFIATESRENHLDFAMLLLFHRIHGRFPRSAIEVD
jgi:hypothetical protein